MDASGIKEAEGEIERAVKLDCDCGVSIVVYTYKGFSAWLIEHREHGEARMNVLPETVN